MDSSAPAARCRARDTDWNSYNLGNSRRLHTTLCVGCVALSVIYVATAWPMRNQGPPPSPNRAFPPNAGVRFEATRPACRGPCLEWIAETTARRTCGHGDGLAATGMAAGSSVEAHPGSAPPAEFRTKSRNFNQGTRNRPRDLLPFWQDGPGSIPVGIIATAPMPIDQPLATRDTGLPLANPQEIADEALSVSGDGSWTRSA